MYPYSHELFYPDIAYMKTFYPNSISSLYELLSDCVDQLEYEGSILYDEVPDYESFLRLANDILTLYSASSDSTSHSTSEKDLVLVLLANEMIHRRIRKKEYIFLQ